MSGRPFAPFCDSENDSDDDDGGVSLVASTRQPPPATKQPAVPTPTMKQTTLPGASRVAPKAKQQQQQQQQQQKLQAKPQQNQQPKQGASTSITNTTLPQSLPSSSSSLKRPPPPSSSTRPAQAMPDANPAKRQKPTGKSDRSDSEDYDDDDEDDEEEDEEEETSSEEDVDTGESDENDDESDSDDSEFERRAKKGERQRLHNERSSQPPPSANYAVAGVAVPPSESAMALQRLRETLSQLQTAAKPECRVNLERAVEACSDDHKSMERVVNHLIDAVKTFSAMEDEPHPIGPHMNRRKLATVVLSNFETTLPKLEAFKNDARAQAIAAQELSTKADSLFAAHASIVDAMACVLKIGSR